ncbi:MAG: hypothetical protein Q8Q50_06060 [Methylobacter sp.]|nr:hypothetical protein [Methylobacter sp.]
MNEYNYKTREVHTDMQLIELTKESGWEILGAGFKLETTFTAKDINKRLWNEVTPWFNWIAIPCIDDTEMFWLAQKEV